MIRGICNAIADQRVRREWRWLTLVRIGRWLLPNYRFMWPQMVWWQDRDFNSYLEKFGLLYGHESDRRWMLNQLTKLVQNVPGDTAECGVHTGSSSYLICKALRRQHFLFDSFEGLSAPDWADGDCFCKNDLSIPLEVAQRNLAEFANLSFRPGWIPERFEEVKERRFCFVHIDLQLYQPTRDSLEFFYPLMNPGGVIICDDYGFTTCPGATKAFDEFLHDRTEKLISLSCGSAFLVRD